MSRNSEINTVRDLIDWRAGAQPDFAFLVSPETGRVLTFKGLQEQLHHLCGRFVQLGLERGDKIAFLMDNGLFTAQLFLGTMYGGFVSVPLNVRAGVSQLSYMIDHCDAKVVFVESKYAALIQEVMPDVRRAVEIVSVPNDDFHEEKKAPFTIDDLGSPAADDAAMLMYSSGRPGNRKALSIPTRLYSPTDTIPFLRTSSRRRIGLFLFFHCIISTPSA